MLWQSWPRGVASCTSRYFQPVSREVTLQYEGESLDLTSLLPKFFQPVVQHSTSVEGEAEVVPDEEEEGECVYVCDCVWGGCGCVYH